MVVLCGDDFVQGFDRFVETDDVVENGLVDFVGVLEFSEIDSLCSTNDLNFSSMGD